jgi:hypothetical protein
MGFRYSRGRVDALLIEANYLADHPSRSGAIDAPLACLDALVVTLDPIAAIKAGNTLAEHSAELTAISILCTHG